MNDSKLNVLDELDLVLKDRKNASSKESYVSDLYSRGNSYINSKIQEECAEYIESTENSDRSHMIHEAADLWFHTLVSLSLNEISSSDILKELETRFGLSGIDEKRLRKK